MSFKFKLHFSARVLGQDGRRDEVLLGDRDQGVQIRGHGRAPEGGRTLEDLPGPAEVPGRRPVQVDQLGVRGVVVDVGILAVWHRRRRQQVVERGEPVLVADGLVVKAGFGDQDLGLFSESDQNFEIASAHRRIGLAIGDLLHVRPRLVLGLFAVLLGLLPAGLTLTLIRFVSFNILLVFQKITTRSMETCCQPGVEKLKQVPEQQEIGFKVKSIQFDSYQ